MIPIIIALSIATVALYFIAAKRGKETELYKAASESWQQITSAKIREIVALNYANNNLKEQAKQDEAYITAHRRVIDARDQENQILQERINHLHALNEIHKARLKKWEQLTRNASAKKSLPMKKQSSNHRISKSPNRK